MRPVSQTSMFWAEKPWALMKKRIRIHQNVKNIQIRRNLQNVLVDPYPCNMHTTKFTSTILQQGVEKYILVDKGESKCIKFSIVQCFHN